MVHFFISCGSLRRFLASLILAAFVFNSVVPPSYAQALNLPQAGTRMDLSGSFAPLVLKGMTLHKDDPLVFDFIVDNGETGLAGQALTDQTTKLVKYFLAGLAVPEKDLWVNLSPYEKDRTIEESLSQTDMGRDMLAQDYILKQMASSLTYPDSDLGKKFWERVYALAQEKLGTTEIPVDTFNKVWITPANATVYHQGDNVMVADAHLKVMLESDYLAMQVTETETKDGDVTSDVNVPRPSSLDQDSDATKQILREVILPVLETEVNTGKNFAPIRQIFHSLILANWYKNALKQSLLAQVYADSKKTAGIDIIQPKEQVEAIYNQYLDAFKKGVFNFIKEDADPVTGETVPRKYFSGGVIGAFKTAETANPAQVSLPAGDAARLTFRITPAQAKAPDAAMTTATTKEMHFAVTRNKQGKPATLKIVGPGLTPGTSNIQMTLAMFHAYEAALQNSITHQSVTDHQENGEHIFYSLSVFPRYNRLSSKLQPIVEKLALSIAHGRFAASPVDRYPQSGFVVVASARGLVRPFVINGNRFTFWEGKADPKQDGNDLRIVFEDEKADKGTPEQLLRAAEIIKKYLKEKENELYVLLAPRTDAAMKVVTSVELNGHLLEVAVARNAFSFLLDHLPEAAGDGLVSLDTLSRTVLKDVGFADAVAYAVTDFNQERGRNLVLDYDRTADTVTGYRLSNASPEDLTDLKFWLEQGLASTGEPAQKTKPQAAFQGAIDFWNLKVHISDVQPTFEKLAQAFIGKRVEWRQTTAVTQSPVVFIPIKDQAFRNTVMVERVQNLILQGKNIFYLWDGQKTRYQEYFLGRPNDGLFIEIFGSGSIDKGLEEKRELTEEQVKTLTLGAEAIEKWIKAVLVYLESPVSGRDGKFTVPEFPISDSDAAMTSGQITVGLKGSAREAGRELWNADQRFQGVNVRVRFVQLENGYRLEISQDDAYNIQNIVPILFKGGDASLPDRVQQLFQINAWYSSNLSVVPSAGPSIESIAQELRYDLGFLPRPPARVLGPGDHAMTVEETVVDALRTGRSVVGVWQQGLPGWTYNKMVYPGAIAKYLEPRPEQQVISRKDQGNLITAAEAVRRARAIAEKGQALGVEILASKDKQTTIVVLDDTNFDAAMAQRTVKVLFADAPAGKDATVTAVGEALATVNAAFPSWDVEIIPLSGVGEKGVEDLKRVIKFEKPAVVLVRSTITFTPELLDLGKANGLQAVIRMGAGYDNIDYEYAAEKGISVIRTHGNANSVADLTLYLLAALGKMADFPVKDVTTLAPTPWWSDIAKTEQFEYLKLTLSSKKWPAKDITQTDKDAVSGKIVDRLSSIEEPVLALETVLNGKVVGLLGFGPIPQAVAAKLQKIKETSGADITVIAATRSFDLNDPERLAEAKRLGVQPVTREELFRRANIVSVHVPDGLGLELTREEMSGPNLIAIVNTARENLFPISLASEFVSNRFLVGDFDLKKGFFDLMKEHPDRVMILPHIGASTQDAGRGIEDNTLAVVPELVARLLGKTPSEDAPVVDIVNDVPVPVLPDAAMAATELGWNLGYARDYLQTSIGAASVVNGSERTPELDQEILQNARSAAYELEIIGTAASRKLALRLRAMAVEDLLPREAWDEIRSALDAVQAELTASAALTVKGEVVLSTGESVSAAWAEDLLVGLREDLRFARPEHNKLAFDMMQKMIPNTSGQRLFVLTRHYLAQDLWAFLGRQPGLPAVAAEGLGEDRPFALARIDGEPLGQEILEAVKAWEAQVTDTIRSSSDAAMGAEELEQFDVKVVERLREAIRSGLSVDIQELATSFSEYFRLQPITKGDRFPSLDVVEKSGNHRPRKTVILDKNGESQDYLWFDNLPSGVQGKAYWISLTDRPLLVLVMDNAQVVKTPGGIDLRNGEYLKVIERDASGMPVFDPAQVEKLRQDLRGFMPVPIGAPQPVNLRQLLGLADDGTPLLPQTAGATVTPAVIPDAAFLDRREAGEEALV